LERVLSREKTNKPARLALTDVLAADEALETKPRTRRGPSSASLLADAEPVYLLAKIEMQRGDPQDGLGN